MTTPAGWYPDPEHPTKQRYWDGQQWTEAANPSAAAAHVSDFGRSEEDVTRAVAAILWRHSKTNPLDAISRCSGGEPRCAFPMDADAFYRHQARAVVEEVFVPELDSFVGRAHMATQAVEGLAELAAAVSRNEAPRLNETRPLLSPDAKQKTERLYRGSRLVGWLVFLGMGAGFLIVLLKS